MNLFRILFLTLILFKMIIQNTKIQLEIIMNLEPHRLLELAETYGTPIYVYDLNRIKERYQYFQSAFSWPELTSEELIRSILRESIDICTDQFNNPSNTDCYQTLVRI